MPVLTQSPLVGDVVKYECNPNFTREVVTLLTGSIYEIGSVLGQITTGGKYKLSTDTGSDGAQVAAGVLIQRVDASAGDAQGLIVKRGPALVADALLLFDASVSDAPKKAAKRAQLVTLGIVPRVAV